MPKDVTRTIEYYTKEEIQSILNSLTDVELKAISLSARYISKSHHNIEPDELINEAICSVLKDHKTRLWPRNISPQVFFKNAMLSHADNLSKKSFNKNNVKLDSELSFEDDESFIENTGHLENTENEIDATKKLEKIQNYFSNDQEVMAIIIGRMQGFTDNEIKNRFKLTHNKYESARRRLARSWPKIGLED